MIFIIIIIIVFLIILYLSRNKITIKIKTFFKKGFAPMSNAFGVYCYCGKQGSSKTLNCVRFLYDNRDRTIFANLRSLDKATIPYTYINGIDELLELRREHDIVIFYDEIFTEISKLLKMDNQKAKDILDFLSQMRKRRIIFLTTCQEWRLLPLYFRLYVRYQVNCSIKKVPLFKGIIIKRILNGDNITWDDKEQDFVGELLHTYIEKTNSFIGGLYDTYEQIGKYSDYSVATTTNATEWSMVKDKDLAKDFYSFEFSEEDFDYEE